ncbi:MAG: hypothetical protein HYY84_14210 [Deltaproteobacteria bacterium]|nr:hypothetical protein [Deltaproteobacteria bacterium]
MRRQIDQPDLSYQKARTRTKFDVAADTVLLVGRVPAVRLRLGRALPDVGFDVGAMFYVSSDGGLTIVCLREEMTMVLDRGLTPAFLFFGL